MMDKMMFDTDLVHSEMEKAAQTAEILYQRINHMDTLMTQLRTIWSGAAADAFLLKYSQTSNEYKDIAVGLKEDCDFIRKSAAEYDKSADYAQNIVNSLR